MRGILKICIVGCLLVTLFVSLFAAYGLWWGVAYLQPRGADKIVDLRKGKTVATQPMLFCAGLANNPHGFPGHAYVVWSKKDTLGICPKEFWSIVLSLSIPVEGVVDDRASTGNDRNLEKLVVLVDDATYKRSRAACARWDATNFRTGSRDCCAFIDFVAAEIGLVVPKSHFIYHHDHIAKLKTLN